MTDRTPMTDAEKHLQAICEQVDRLVDRFIAFDPVRPVLPPALLELKRLADEARSVTSTSPPSAPCEVCSGTEHVLVATAVAIRRECVRCGKRTRHM